jgi:hypothetical protein
MREKRRNDTDAVKREAIRWSRRMATAWQQRHGDHLTMGRWKRAFETKPSAAFPGNGRRPLDKEEGYR